VLTYLVIFIFVFVGVFFILLQWNVNDLMPLHVSFHKQLAVSRCVGSVVHIWFSSNITVLGKL